MIIKTRKTVKIGRKTHAPETTINVTNEVGRDLVTRGLAWCVDGTMPVIAVKYNLKTNKKK